MTSGLPDDVLCVLLPKQGEVLRQVKVGGRRNKQYKNTDAERFFANETACPTMYFVYFKGKAVHSCGKRSGVNI